MTYSREERSVSPGRRHRSRSPTRSRRSRSRSRSRDSQDAVNPGNNLYVTGLSTRVTSGDLEKYFGREGKVVECHLVTDPRTRESRGFAFVTMETVEGAERCIMYLNHSVLEGRLITVEKAKRSRGRTPTPGRYRGLRDRRGRGCRRSRSYSPRRYDRDSQIYAGRGCRRSRSYSPRRYDRDYYPRGRQGISRSRSPYGRRKDDYDSNRRRQGCSLSGDGGGYRR